MCYKETYNYMTSHGIYIYIYIYIYITFGKLQIVSDAQQYKYQLLYIPKTWCN